MIEGQIVEYIDDQKVLCAAVLETKKNRVRVLNENNREVNLSEKRISLISDEKISMKSSRDHIAETLKKLGAAREELAKNIDIEELWEVLNSETDWVDVDMVAELNFGDEIEAKHKSAIVRAMLYDKLYFKFNHTQFLPFTEKQVQQLITKKEEEARKKLVIETGSLWLKNNISTPNPEPLGENELPIVNIISSYYLLENEAPDADIARAIFKEAGIEPGLKIFKFLVRLGIWDKDENTDLLKYEIESKFSNNIKDSVSTLKDNLEEIDFSKRKDLTSVKIFTIDGKNTKDFDDAISFEIKDGKKYAGVHITDVGFFIKKDTPIDRNAMYRSSSIYMPEQKIPMLHPDISEDIASLVENQLRPAVTIMMELDKDYSVKDYEIFPSVIKVTDQITYDKADELIKSGQSTELENLAKAAQKFREQRFAAGAVHIAIPDVDVYVDEDKNIEIKVLNRETLSWLLVSEFMIKSNFLMADFLKNKEVPAIYRGQGKPETRFYDQDKGTLHEQLLQRKEMSRVIISTTPEPHCGLGLNYYITSTSPVRKYFDLVCQRQIKSVFDLEKPYTEEELNEITNIVENSSANIGRVQFARKRYWILKYLEAKRGEKEPALVINDKRHNYAILLLNYMLEARLTRSPGMNLKPGDNIQVTIQNVNARSDILSVHIN